MFDKLVTEALTNRPDLLPLQMAVEKELLHHDILRVLGGGGFLERLAFIGGTCLRECYGSNRLSEDLDFTGGTEFCKESLTGIATILKDSFNARYGLRLEVGEPTRDSGNTDTWKIKVLTRPERRDMPAQRINIDVCAIPSYETRPMLLLNPYGVDMGTGGLILQAQSREEIFIDKLVAFALRPNRIKHRDLWDIGWLHQQDIAPRFTLLAAKMKDHCCQQDRFLGLFEQRLSSLALLETATAFRVEMRRFLPANLVAETIDKPAFWTWLTGLMTDLGVTARKVLTDKSPVAKFRM